MVLPLCVVVFLSVDKRLWGQLKCLWMNYEKRFWIRRYLLEQGRISDVLGVIHHIRFWYLRCCGCPGLRGRHLWYGSMTWNVYDRNAYSKPWTRITGWPCVQLADVWVMLRRAMKEALRETQTLRAGCSKAKPNIFAPTQTPSWGRGTAKI